MRNVFLYVNIVFECVQLQYRWLMFFIVNILFYYCYKLFIVNPLVIYYMYMRNRNECLYSKYDEYVDTLI